MEALESGGAGLSLAADPLLSAALSSPLHHLTRRMSSPHPAHASPHGSPSPHQVDVEFFEYTGSVGGRNGGSHHRGSPHAATIYGFSNNYATLTAIQPIQPLPPISTVTSNGGSDKYRRSSISPSRDSRSQDSNYFFPPSSQGYNNYNVTNIKYEYELKTEDEPDSPGGQNDPQSHSSDNPFSPSNYAAAYNSLELREPKLEKDCFSYNGYANGDCDSDDVGLLSNQSPSPKKGSPILNGSLDDDDLDDGEELNTKDLAQKISAELKRYSIPQAIFAQRVLCRSQGTLSDLLRNPKPWSKLKSGRETFRRMAKWLQEPEFQRMSALRMAACKRKEEQQVQCNQPQPPKKPRLVFTDIQRRTLQAIFKETKRPSREMQMTISQQLGLDPTTVANFFMNARRRGHDQRPESDLQGGANSVNSVSSSSSNGSSQDLSNGILGDDQVC
ncbi:unnamed protein product [Auanema sp. JU1783]|nr:unnamed protein product [Auanema sp. JU1783]